MKIRYVAFFLILVLASAVPLRSTKVDPAERAASHILLGRVEGADGFYGVTERGDNLIYSRVRVKADKWLKGKNGNSVEFVVEGGSVGDVGLRVSDIPEFSKGQTVKLYLKKTGLMFNFQEGEILEEVDIKAKAAQATGGCCKSYASWPGGAAVYLVNPNCNDATVADAAAEIKAGADEWNAGLPVLAYGGTTALAVTANDGQNLVYFCGGCGGSTIARTYFWYSKRSGQMLGFDIIFYDAWPFYDQQHLGSCINDGFPLRTIAAHELGHGVGIDHNRCPDSIMYPYAIRCIDNHVTEIDLACLAKLYQ
ncbi:MAG: matrixin family metalloprotease [Candidatus Aminicenantes bacterium]|nr:matrixin family metalloprotease [Candidatus Aminicenantes bacterium]